MIDRYGKGAIIQAALQGNALLAQGRRQRSHRWLKIIIAIERLQATKPADGESVQQHAGRAGNDTAARGLAN